MAGIRVVAPDAATAWCETGEIMVSAVCVGGASTTAVTTYTNGAKCGYGETTARPRILCAPPPAQ